MDSIPMIEIPEFNHFLVSGNLSCYQLFTVTNCAIINILVHISLHKCIYVAIGKIPRG